MVLVPQLLTPAEVDRIRDVYTTQIETDRSLGFDDGLPADDILSRYPRIVHPHRRPDSEVGEIALELMLDERILDVVTELIGPALAAQSMFYFKPPTARGQALHQDNLYLQAHPETCIAAWIAVDDCDADNGGLAVVPGSHVIHVMCPEEADPEVSFTNVTVPVPEGIEVVQTEMKAGDVLFFHGSVVHGSRPEQHHRPVPPVADLPLHPAGQRRGVDVLPAADHPGRPGGHHPGLPRRWSVRGRLVGRRSLIIGRIGSADVRSGRDPGPAGGVQQDTGGDLEALDPAERHVLVLDVDQHVRVDLVQRAQEPVASRRRRGPCRGRRSPRRSSSATRWPTRRRPGWSAARRVTAGGSGCPARRTAAAAGLTLTSLAAAWKTSGPRSWTTATGSICCQNRCEASSSTPTWVAPVRSTSSRIRRC